MIEKRGLGRGLSALIPSKEKTTQGAGYPQSEVFLLELDKIQPNPYQPRENFDAEGLGSLIDSIREKGVIQPVLVRRTDLGYELIAGERRLRAAKSLNMREIPAIVKEVKDEGSLEIALIENIQRQDLNPIEEAQAFRHLIDRFAYTQDMVAHAVGKARVSVANILRLLKLPSEIQGMLRKGEISTAHGKVLLEVQDEKQQLCLAHRVIEEKLPVSGLEALIFSAGHSRKSLLKPPGQDKDARHIQALAEELQQLLGTRVRVSLRRKGGSIKIEFYSEEDLERIYKQIVK